MKLWGGRFEQEKDSFMEKFDSSFPVDKLLWEQDIEGSKAHVTMLGECGIIEVEEAEKIVEALEELKEEIANKDVKLAGEFEDIHSFVEYHIVKKLGDVGKKMHTARSRNEQVAVDMKLFVKLSIPKLLNKIESLQETLKEKGNTNLVFMPGYTHMQRAQIITFKYYLMSYHDMLERDKTRLKNALQIMNTCPLGSGALAGSTFDVDRNKVSNMLGFKKPQENTLDSVSDRDYIIECVSDMSILMMHLSRLSEELILYSTKEFDFITLSDAYSTGSSLMPQKKNPDSLELVRGKTGRVYGNLMGMLTLMKGLPLAYNKDMQEDKQYYFESYTTVMDCLTIINGVISTMTVKKEHLNHEIEEGFLNATELAEYLVRKKVAFRDAHELVGKIVSYCEKKHCEIHDLSLEELKHFYAYVEEDVYESVSPNTILHKGNKRYML